MRFTVLTHWNVSDGLLTLHTTHPQRPWVYVCMYYVCMSPSSQQQHMSSGCQTNQFVASPDRRVAGQYWKPIRRGVGATAAAVTAVCYIIIIIMISVDRRWTGRLWYRLGSASCTACPGGKLIGVDNVPTHCYMSCTNRYNNINIK